MIKKSDIGHISKPSKLRPELLHVISGVALDAESLVDQEVQRKCGVDLVKKAEERNLARIEAKIYGEAKLEIQELQAYLHRLDSWEYVHYHKEELKGRLKEIESLLTIT